MQPSCGRLHSLLSFGSILSLTRCTTTPDCVSNT
jgi:hypothetical protein